MSDRRYLEVVVAEAEGRFHYHLPSQLEKAELAPGNRLIIPFGRALRIGYFIRTVDHPDVESTKAVLALLDQEPLIPLSLFQLLSWLSDYYFAPLGEVLKGALPPGMNVVVRRRYTLTPLGVEEAERCKAPLQKKALDRLSKEGTATDRDFKKNEGLGGALATLRKKGWIEERWEVDRPPVQTQYRKILFLKTSVEETLSLIETLKKKAPQQARTIETLFSAGGTLPAAAFEALLRAPLKRLVQKKIIEETEEEAPRVPRMDAGFKSKGTIQLNLTQQAAADEIISALDRKSFSPFLLHGVTGSGKTEVYLQVIGRALEQKRGAILLVPEIALTAQLVVRFHGRFGEAIALLHSGLSAGERHDEWRRIREGKAFLAIGARSAIFAPLEKVGVIIVDEEQDPSYKQEEGYRYHARDLALVRGKAAGAVVVLGSATPSFESFHNSRTGKYLSLALPERIDARPLPPVTVIDFREKEKWVRPYLTAPLVSAIEKRLAVGEQTLLFINRRGFSPSLLCADCGHLPCCLRCSVSLTYHKQLKKLICHYCGFQLAPPSACSECNGVHLIYLGIGTEQVEEQIRALFPQARVARMDRDTTQKKDSSHKILAGMEQGEIDILIGTQMIAKGHDFPNVTLVGVLCADLSLQVPDFRASERTFQLLAQVAGRAGRGNTPGEVIFQTFHPDHEAIVSATRHDFLGFYEREILFRKEIGYPPFCRMTLLQLSHRDEKTLAERSAAFCSLLQKLLPQKGVTLLGPAPAPLARLRGAYRYQILLKAGDQKKIAASLKIALERWDRSERKGVTIEVNVDPQNFV